MPLRFTVLGSGSSGNAAVLECNGFGVLIDAGLGPRVLTQRLAAAGLSWQNVHAMLLTHTHSDHWKEHSLLHLLRRRVPLHCHAGHLSLLQESSPAFVAMRAGQLVQEFSPPRPWQLAPGLRCRALPLSHDGGPTFGFRFETESAAVAYVADLGTWSPELAQQLLDVDILALEFNHDVEMEKRSSRAPYLIARVLGDRGHLSNEQAAGLLREVVTASHPGRVQHVVQLHLSRDCNRATLAVAAAKKALLPHAEKPVIHTARHDVAGPSLLLPDEPKRARRVGRRQADILPCAKTSTPAQQFLPGWEAG
jgi:phosphoribosyl 1,2-cyclic phosphodiesterase